jgi:hypothetical protein
VTKKRLQIDLEISGQSLCAAIGPAGNLVRMFIYVVVLLTDICIRKVKSGAIKV